MAAGLVLAGSLAGAPAAHAKPATTDTTTVTTAEATTVQTYGMRLVMCYYLPWMC